MNILKWTWNTFGDSHMYINVITNVGLFSTFVAIFFFTYASTIEQNIIISQTKIITTDLLQTIKPLLSEAQRAYYKKNLTVPDMRAEDINALNSNNALINTAYGMLLIVFVVAIVVGLILAIIFKHNYYKIIGFNLIILLIVGLTEFTFLHFIPQNYITADTNFIRYTILSKLREKIIVN